MSVQQVYGSVTVDGTDYPIVIGGSGGSGRDGGNGTSTKVGLQLKADRHNTAGQCKVAVYAPEPPQTGSPMRVWINGTTVFTGTLRSRTPGAGDRHRLTAYDAAWDLKKTTVTQSYTTASVATIARDAAAAAGIDIAVSVPTEYASPEFKAQTAATILSKVATWSDGIWYVDIDNTVHVTADVSSVSRAHHLQRITAAHPEESIPPYQSVRVIGTSPASRKGLKTMHLIPSQPIVATAGEGEPQYTYRSEDIRTQSMAQKSATAIRKELLRQRYTGTIDIVGDPAIRPYDTILLPPAQGDAEFLVTGIKHRLDGQEGFTTAITPGGVVV